MKEFPKELFVAVEEEEYFAANETAAVFAVIDDTRPVARYMLVGKGVVVNQSSYREVPEGGTQDADAGTAKSRYDD
jgi:hypothetical protein